MRITSLVLIATLAGCAAAPFAAGFRASTEVATLSVRERPGYPFSGGYDGIVEVDGHAVPDGPAKSVTLESGMHTFSYRCPGWLSVDRLPELSHLFRAGDRYELDCGNAPHLEEDR